MIPLQELTKMIQFVPEKGMILCVEEMEMMKFMLVQETILSMVKAAMIL